MTCQDKGGTEYSKYVSTPFYNNFIMGKMYMIISRLTKLDNLFIISNEPIQEKHFYILPEIIEWCNNI